MNVTIVCLVMKTTLEVGIFQEFSSFEVFRKKIFDLKIKSPADIISEERIASTTLDWFSSSLCHHFSPTEPQNTQLALSTAFSKQQTSVSEKTGQLRYIIIDGSNVAMR